MTCLVGGPSQSRGAETTSSEEPGQPRDGALRPSGERTTYGALVQEIAALSYGPRSPALSELLCEIARRTVREGKGMLSAVVVHAGDPDDLPGDGFFALQAELGRDVSGSLEERWLREFEETIAAYAAEG